jgi:hypothetical protein
MRIDQARSIAQRWVEENAAAIPGFQGAFVHGSGAALPDDADLPDSSDFDVMVVIDGPMPETKLGKFRYEGLLLEISYLPGEDVSSAKHVLGQYHLAGSFRNDGILADPTGRLTTIQREVARDFAKRKWVIRRCEHARERVLTGLQTQATDPFPDQVNSWLFPCGVLTHILLVAGLKNPTVRTRYLATRELLESYGLDAFYPMLLSLLGADRLSREETKHHLQALTLQFDAAAAIVSPSYPFAADLSETGKAVAIGGSRELIRQGNYQEAIFWMLATATRCQQVFRRDGTPELLERFAPPYRRFLADLGIVSTADLALAKIQVEAFIPLVWEVAEIIIEANPEIVD